MRYLSCRIVLWFGAVVKRRTIPAFAVAIAVLVGSTACTTSGPVATAAPLTSPTHLPAALVLAASGPSTSFVSYRFSATDNGVTETGLVDPANSRTQTTTDLGTVPGGILDQQFISIGDQAWEKIDVTSSNGAPAPYQGLPTTWMHLDTTRVRGAVLGTIRSSDQPGVSTFLNAIGSAEQTGPAAYRGTLKGQQLYTWQDPPATVPFTATVDGKGRLLTFEATAGQAFAYTATFSEYDLPVTITAPTNATEAPAPLYTLLG